MIINFERIFLFVVVLNVIFFSSCSHETEDKITKLSISLTEEVPYLEPARAYDTISSNIMYQCYETLYEYHYLKRPYSVIPLLAEDMPRITNNGMTYTIKIKKNVQYHNDPAFKGKTRFVKAQDFINQFKRLAYTPLDSAGLWLFDGKIKGIKEFKEKVGTDFNKFKSETISGLKTPDDHTLIIELEEPYPQLIYSLTLTFTTPVPAEVIEFYNNDLNQKIVGTGPYKLKEILHKDQERFVLERFKDYRESYYPSEGDRTANTTGLLQDAGKRIPFIDEIHFFVVPDVATRWDFFVNKKIDFNVLNNNNYSVALDQDGKLQRILEEKGIDLSIAPTQRFWWLAFNMKDPILGKNLNLRKAIAHAINVDEYIRKYTNNTAQKANSIYPPGTPGYDPNAMLPYEYNLEKAKKYLELAGYKDGKNLPVIKYDIRDEATHNLIRANYIKESLAKIGIKIEVIQNTFQSFLTKEKFGVTKFWQGGWTMDYFDAENILQLFITKNFPPGPNTSFYSNPQFDQLFQRLKLMQDGPDKFQLMKEMEEIINNDVALILLFYARDYVLVHKHLKNYRHSDIINNNMKYLRIE